MNVGRPFQEISRAGRWSRVEQPSHNPGRIQAERRAWPSQPSVHNMAARLRHVRPAFALSPELRATATMLATEHARAARNPAGWRVAVVVLRYFVAVRLAQTPRSYCISCADGSARA